MNRFIGILVALMLAILGVEEIILQFFFKGHNFLLLPAIPLFFILLGTAAIKFVYSKKESSVAALMGVKMVKILLSLMFILVYVFFIKEQAVSFLMSYLIYFLAFLVFETWMLSAINKKNKSTI